MQIKLTLVKSPIGRPEGHRKTLQALGLTKIGTSAVHEDTPAVQGMIRKCAHLVAVENIGK